MHQLLGIYIGLKLFRFLAELFLASLNRRYYKNVENQEHAKKRLGISDENMSKTFNYTEDRYKFSVVSGWAHTLVEVGFIVWGGLGWLEALAIQIANSYLSGSNLSVGLLFFGLFACLSFLFNLPFGAYSTFVIEQKHGFNRQTVGGFFADTAKGILIGGLLGGLLLALLLTVMESLGSWWWLGGWAVMSVFSLFAAWIYPSLLAPLFNKFSPLGSGPLQDSIEEFAKKIGFRTNGIYVMDASKRSSHGNAYFTGLFGEKRIVLFDTLLDSMKDSQVVAVRLMS